MLREAAQNTLIKKEKQAMNINTLFLKDKKAHIDICTLW